MASTPWGDQMSAQQATASVMVHSKLTAEAGMASASAAAQQAKLKLQKKHQQELLEAALTPPQQRTNAQIEQLCDFLSSCHLLRSLQPTALKSLAHAMRGIAHPAGEVIYQQGELAQHLYVVLSGEVAMYERDEQQDPNGAKTAGEASSSSGGSTLTSSRSPQGAGSTRAGSGSGLRTQQSPRHQRSPSPSTHKPGSPRRLGSAAGIHHSGSTAGGHHHGSPRGAAGSPRCGQGASQGPLFSEVRKVKPREAFGEDEVTAHTRREQCAVAIAATKQTFAAHSSLSGGGSTARATASAGGGSSSSNSNSAGGAEPAAPAGASDGGQVSAPAAAVSAQAAPSVLAAAAAAADPRSQCVLLVLSAEDYGAALEGRLTGLLEEKVTFLAGLPAMRGLNMQYLRALSHCFHQVTFEPREVVVQQGDISDSMFVLKSGQVCVLIDPHLTLAEASTAEASSEDGARAGPAHQAGAEPSTASDLDKRKLVQVCLLGGGAIIGDMSVRESGGAPPRRSATVVALTELVTYKVPLKEFKRRMPADVLEGMRQVANQKLEMNDQKAQGRALANGRDGQVLLGGLALPECVLQGKGLRALLDAQQQVAPVGGLIQALELCVGGSNSTSKARTGGLGGSSSGSNSPRQPPAKKWFVSGTKAAVEVEGFLDSLSRNGFLAAPPNEFLALMTDWRSPRTDSQAPPQQVPPGYVFPLPLPGKKQAATTAAALSAANSQLHPAQGTMASLTHAAGGVGAVNTWTDPAVTTHTISVSRPHTPQQPDLGAQNSPRGGSNCGAAATGASLADQPLLSSPLSLLAALSLDQYVQSPLGSPGGSRHASRPTTPAGGGAPGGRQGPFLNAAAVAREATQQLMGGGMLSPKASSRAAGGMAGRGTLLRGPLAAQGASGPAEGTPKGYSVPADINSKAAAHTTSPFAATTLPGHRNDKEPTVEEATIKVSVLFRPGSPISIGRAGSSRLQGHGSDRLAAAASHAGASVFSPPPPPQPALEGLGVHAAVITRSTGKQELTFHAAAGPGSAIPLPQS